MDTYSLINRQVVPVTLLEFAMRQLGTKARRVGNTQIGDVRVSTVFVGIDSTFCSDKPMVFESVTFGLIGAGELQTRCSTWKQAELMHEMMCDVVRELPEWKTK